MSGGHWDYAGTRIRDEMDRIASDEQLQKDCPALAAVLTKLSAAIEKVEHELDWHYSGDASIPVMELFQRGAVQSLAIAASHEFTWPGNWPMDKRRSPSTAPCAVCGVQETKHGERTN